MTSSRQKSNFVASLRYRGVQLCGAQQGKFPTYYSEWISSARKKRSFFSPQSHPRKLGWCDGSGLSPYHSVSKLLYTIGWQPFHRVIVLLVNIKKGIEKRGCVVFNVHAAFFKTDFFQGGYYMRAYIWDLPSLMYSCSCCCYTGAGSFEIQTAFLPCVQIYSHSVRDDSAISDNVCYKESFAPCP